MTRTGCRSASKSSVYGLLCSALPVQVPGSTLVLKSENEALRDLEGVSVRKQHPAAIQLPHFSDRSCSKSLFLKVDERGLIPRVGLVGLLGIGAHNRSAAWLES